MTIEDTLQAALDDTRLIRIEREEFEDGLSELDGYVTGVGEELLCMGIVDDRVRLGGFEILWTGSISSVDAPGPHAEFYEAALRMRGESMAVPPPIELTSIRSALESVAKISPLVVVHREVEEPDVCEIGQLHECRDETFVLREIDPDAKWIEEVAEYRYDEVTRIGFSGDYEGALALVAGLVE